MLIHFFLILFFIFCRQNDSNNVPDNLQHKYRSYTQIKNELKELNMAVKSDMDIVDELSIKFLEKLKVHDDSESDLKNILTDLENLLHQVDTAEVFAKNRGYVINIFIFLLVSRSFEESNLLYCLK